MVFIEKKNNGLPWKLYCTGNNLLGNAKWPSERQRCGGQNFPTWKMKKSTVLLSFLLETTSDNNPRVFSPCEGNPVLLCREDRRPVFALSVASLPPQDLSTSTHWVPPGARQDTRLRHQSDEYSTISSLEALVTWRVNTIIFKTVW